MPWVNRMALGGFSAEVFERCLQQRWKAYVEKLEPEEAQLALLRWLCRHRLDWQITMTAPNPLAKADES
jgi:hypothetical protein